MNVSEDITSSSNGYVQKEGDAEDVFEGTRDRKQRKNTERFPSPHLTFVDKTI